MSPPGQLQGLLDEEEKVSLAKEVLVFLKCINHTEPLVVRACSGRHGV